MKIKIDGVGVVQVGDEFKNMSPDDQNAFVAHITQQASAGKKSGLPGPSDQAAPPPDKYQKAAQEDVARMNKLEMFGPGMGRRLLQGMTFGAGDELMAAADTPFEMFRQGTLNPVEGYNYAKAFQDERLKQARQNTGFAGDVAELGGGLLGGGNLAKAGLSLVRPGQGLLARTGAMAGEGAGYGGITGFNEGEGLADRLKGGANGAAAGAVVGGAIPLAASAAKTIASPAISNIMARVDPEGAARARLGQAVGESGKSLNDVAYDLSNAGAAGQGEFTVADALGNPGQRLLSTVARAPGEGRTQAVEFLNNRQAGQADRVGNIIDESLGVDKTGRQLASEKRAQAISEATPLYEKALGQPTVWTNRLQQFIDDPMSKIGLRRGLEIQRLESLAKGEPFNPHDYAIVDFDAAGDPIVGKVPNMRTMDAIKKGYDSILEDYRDPMSGKLNLDQRGRAIDMVRKSLLHQLDRANPDYAAARAAYAGPASEAEAVGLGKLAATRGRPTDTMDVFNKLGEPQKAAFRTGYADKLQEGIDRGAEGVNATRRFTSGKYQTELPTLALDQGPLRPGEQPEMLKRLGREQQMFETRRQAIGGSQTAENLADQAENQIDPRLAGYLLRGDIMGAGKHAFMGASNVLGGNTPQVRAELGNMLLQNDPKAVYGLLAKFKADQAKVARRRARIDKIAARGLLAGPSEYAGQKLSQ